MIMMIYYRCLVEHLSRVVGPLFDPVVVNVRVDPEQQERRVSWTDDDATASLRLLLAADRTRELSP